MSNTVEYKGGFCEIGKYYEFSDDGEYWDVRLLVGINRRSSYPLASNGDDYKQIRAIEPGSIGTITKAPVKLIDGEAYRFQLEVGDFRLGYWKESRNSFFDSLIYANKICGKSEATNIQHLTVG